jgi:type I restriction enzyme M protein
MKKEKQTKLESLEVTLWKAADKLRKNIDAAEYKHVVLGLIFLRYISDAFEAQYAKLQAGEGEYAGADPEDKDEYTAENVFFVPPSARWKFLQSHAKQPTIGKSVDEAMDAIERENSSLKGVLPKVYARDNLDPTSLGQLIDLISNIAMQDAKDRSADVLGHVFEFFLGEFALAEGKQGGQFYTPRSVVELLVEMLEPYNGRVFDPCCGSGGMFVQSEKFVEDHQGKVDDISIYGQESNQTTWRLAKMNLAIRGIDASKVLWNNEGSFLNDAHKDLKADYIIANKILTAAELMDELIRVSKEIVNGDNEAERLKLSPLEFAFYTAVANNESARELMQKDKLRELAVVLFERVRENATIDWTVKESLRAKLKVIVKRTLRQFGYPPDMAELATETVLLQAEKIANELNKK